jgi:bla regulator protein BlaR1
VIAGMLNHLWQSTLFVLAAALLTLTLRTNHASARHSIWFAASLKFLLPFSALISLGGHLGWLTGVTMAPQWTLIIGNLARPASIQSVFPTPRTLPTAFSYIGYLLAAGWFVGFIAVVNRWSEQWRKIKSCLRSAERIDVGSSIEARSCPSMLEPGVAGIIHPVLLVPADLAQRLPPEQMRAILAHEMSHVRRRDNLSGALHMVVEALFWFYPPVWWLGARLIAERERERACDEAVVHAGNDPQTYAEAILNVCKHYVASPLACASGVSGADLTRRIEYIVANRVAAKLGVTKKLLVILAGSAAVAGPY